MSNALYAGLSGTLAHQESLDVIANNLANVNTIGYKQRAAEFEDCYYESLRGGKAAGDTPGVDPAQVGTGSRIGSVSVLQSQGAIESTGQPLDAALEGPGYFLVSDGSHQFLTRDGSFTLDSSGALVTASTGQKVQGWLADTSGKVTLSGQPTDLTVPTGWTRPAVATSSATCTGNLDASSAVGDSTYCSREVYDSLGNAHTLNLTFTKTNTNEWSVQASCEGATGTGTVDFDTNGALSSGGSLDLPITLSNGAAAMDVNLDLSGMTQRATTSAPTVSDQNGRATSALQDVSIQADGVLQGQFSNGDTVTLGKLAVATVPNPGGLDAASNNEFQTNGASGAIQVGTADTGDRGSIVSQSLEQSTVDITRSFVNMITAQQGFQANTRTISTANELTSEVLKLVQ